MRHRTNRVLFLLWHSPRPDEHVTHKHKCTPTHPQQIQYTFFAAKNRQTHTNTHTDNRHSSISPIHNIVASNNPHIMPPRWHLCTNDAGASVHTVQLVGNKCFRLFSKRSRAVSRRPCVRCAAIVIFWLGVCNANGAEALQLAGLAWSRRKMWLWRLCACAPVRKCGAACRVASLALCVFECVCGVYCFNYLAVFLCRKWVKSGRVVPILTIQTNTRLNCVCMCGCIQIAHVRICIAAGILTHTHDMDYEYSCFIWFQHSVCARIY